MTDKETADERWARVSQLSDPEQEEEAQRWMGEMDAEISRIEAQQARNQKKALIANAATLGLIGAIFLYLFYHFLTNNTTLSGFLNVLSSGMCVISLAVDLKMHFVDKQKIDTHKVRFWVMILCLVSLPISFAAFFV